MKKILSLTLIALFMSSCGLLGRDRKIVEEAKLGQNAPNGPLGVAVCDDFLARYHKCIDEKVPERSKPTYKKALEETAAYWKTQTTTEEEKLGLASACRVAYVGARSTLSAFGCML